MEGSTHYITFFSHILTNFFGHFTSLKISLKATRLILPYRDRTMDEKLIFPQLLCINVNIFKRRKGRRLILVATVHSLYPGVNRIKISPELRSHPSCKVLRKILRRPKCTKVHRIHITQLHHKLGVSVRSFDSLTQSKLGNMTANYLIDFKDSNIILFYNIAVRF